jgi:hypothetical protein
MSIKQRILNLLISLDQFIFCLVCLGHSYPNETASACAWRMEQTSRLSGRIFRPLIDTLFFFDPEHCRVSYEDMQELRFMPKP